MLMLTDEQIKELRASVVRAQAGRWDCPCVWGMIVDGPLAGIRCRLRPEGIAGPAAIMGWCYVTDRGPVVAYHVKAEVPGQWRFRGYEQPGDRARGFEMTSG